VGEPFIGSEAVASGCVTPYALRTRFKAIHRDVYVPRDSEITAVVRARAAWLWSRRRAVVAGRSASALHGAQWIDNRAPAEILYENRHAPAAIRTWSAHVPDDEVTVVNGMRVTTPARTAFDLACRYPVDEAVTMIDALARATRLKAAAIELLAERYAGRRGIRNARLALDLVDPGADSPRETWLRLLLIRAGFPRPESQIPVYDAYGQLVAVVDMGWRNSRSPSTMRAISTAPTGGDSTRTSNASRPSPRWAGSTSGVTAEDTEGSIIWRVLAAWDRRG
jgi:hypothetical protein